MTRLAEVTRGGIVESVHEGMIAVVDVEGRLVASLGDPNAVIFYRSSAKPFQAIPVVESGAAPGGLNQLLQPPFRGREAIARLVEAG